jgi:hypothetical protein
VIQQDLLVEQVTCPYCGECIDILVDPSIPEQSYIEDCQVCCRPITINVKIEMSSGGGYSANGGGANEYVANVMVLHENE